MKMLQIQETEESQSMSAMTDVVFLLLIFFIVTMSSYVETTLLEANLPTAADGSTAPNLANVIRIDIPPAQQGDFYLINGMARSVKDLQTLLARYEKLMPEAEFLIKCAPDSEHRQLVSLLAECSRRHLNNLKLIK